MNKQIIAPVCDIWRDEMMIELETQLLMGDVVRVIANKGDYTEIEALKDGYKGLVFTDLLGDVAPTTHSISALSTYILSGANVKYPAIACLPYKAKIQVARFEEDYAVVAGGYIYAPHVKPHGLDYVQDAERFVGVPYLWGGNSVFGLDCSAFIQTILGKDCPRNSAEQEQHFMKIDKPQRGDLVFWKGHVALMISETEIIHANAFTMNVSRETLQGAMTRVRNVGGGEVVSFRRPHHHLHAQE